MPHRPIDRWIPTNSTGDGSDGLVVGRGTTGGSGEGVYGSGGVDEDGSLGSSHGFSNSLTVDQ